MWGSINPVLREQAVVYTLAFAWAVMLAPPQGYVDIHNCSLQAHSYRHQLANLAHMEMQSDEEVDVVISTGVLSTAFKCLHVGDLVYTKF